MSRLQKIGIVGAGIVGSYLYHMMVNDGYKPDIYDVKDNSKCGTKPCAWLVSPRFIDMMDFTSLDYKKYVTTHHNTVNLNSKTVSNINMMSINKPKLIRDLLGDADICYDKVDPDQYEILIDATGLSRDVLPPMNFDYILPTTQIRIKSDIDHPLSIIFFPVGYLWIIPLHEGWYHVGCEGTPDKTIQQELIDYLVDNIFGHVNEKDFVCGCSANIRVTAPHYSQPFVQTSSNMLQIYGVGEAIGCVSPLTGEGIVPGMISAQILMKNLGKPKQYTRNILQEFKYMKTEREFIHRLLLDSFDTDIKIKDKIMFITAMRKTGHTPGVITMLKLIWGKYVF